MAVVPCSRLLIKPPLTPLAAPLKLVFPAHPRSLVPAVSSPLRLPSLLPSPARRSRRFPARSNGGASETLEESEADKERKKTQEEETEAEKPDAEASTAASSAVAEELKQMMEARRKESAVPSSELWGGVAEEVREIEWPPFSKVLGTTGVVLAVIAGSSVALLTVNAILAEISDKVFVGKGIQDFF